MIPLGVLSNSTMKPSCRLLMSQNIPIILGSAKFHNTNHLSKRSFDFERKKHIFSYPFRILGFRSIIYNAQKSFSIPNTNFGHSRLISGSSYGRRTTNKGISILSCIASEVKGYSTSVETKINDNGFERIYVQNGFGVKPLVVEKIDKDENVVGSEEASRVGIAVPDESENVNRENLNVNQRIEIGRTGREESDIEREAWKLLKDAVVNYCGSPVGTMAANDPGDKQPLNYDQVFIRDFVPSALAFLLKGEGEIVKNFLLHTLQLQSWEKTVDCYSPGQGLMPASFKVRSVPLDENKFEEVLDPDFGESAIGRVAPVDSGLWWIILLRAYGKITGDYKLQERVDVQTGIKLILNLCLADGFDMFPSLLVTDGSCMIDRRMGIHGHPLEIQALFYSALRCSREMLTVNDGSKNLVRAINNRLSALSFHIREYYWVDIKKINEIYRYKTEEYSLDATNKFNIYPEQIPSWLMDWIPEEGGYLIGNLQPAHMDFRFFTLGNLWSVISSLGTPKQNKAILNLIEAKWDDLIGRMPLKICYPALENEDWRIITGSDPKNTPWSYHNGGSWPTLLWQEEAECNPCSFSIAVRACASSIGSLNYGKQLHSYVIKNGCDSSLPVMNPIADMYCWCGCLSEVNRYFHGKNQKDLITWNTLMSRHERSNSIESPFIFSQMELNGIHPYCNTYTSVTTACANLAVLSTGQQLHGVIICRGLDSNRALANALIDMNAKCGNIADLHKI